METKRSMKVEASKEFPVPVEILFKAWNDPVQLKQWWKPMGNQLQEVTNDLQPGGAVRYTFNENTLTIAGEYEEVKENERLVYTWNWNFPEDVVKNAAYKLTVDFKGDADRSSIHVVQEDNQDVETLQPNQEGWEKGLAELQAFLNGSKGNQPADQQNKSSSEEAGYRERPEQQKVGGG